MPRPRKPRMIQKRPVSAFYKPQGVPLADLKGVTLPLEGLEALRLIEVEELEGAAASEMMGVSTATFSRVLSEARAIVARALVNGWAIRIEGGDYELSDRSGRGELRPRGHGRRRVRRGKI
jgi:uncharacterized protein